MNKFWQTLLEINNVSFKYYLGIYLVLLILDIWKEDFVFRVLRFPLSWLMWLVVVSGILKLFFNLEKIISWFEKKNFWRVSKILKVLSILKKLRIIFKILQHRFLVIL